MAYHRRNHKKKRHFFLLGCHDTALGDLAFLSYSFLVESNFNLSAALNGLVAITIPIAVVLALAWRNTLIGSIGFLTIGIFFLFYFEWGDFPIGVVPLIIAGFFFMDWRREHRYSNRP
ncbi:MAG: hypothetical protein PHI41_07115 [Erysipelotrichaceae bacterium]|nr:hypothetical protein [Erysipelotrichaceae bacterium]MDD3810069.1 hypothetical protein [Erysipelotrichaceae bacterium]